MLLDEYGEAIEVGGDSEDEDFNPFFIDEDGDGEDEGERGTRGDEDGLKPFSLAKSCLQPIAKPTELTKAIKINALFFVNLNLYL